MREHAVIPGSPRPVELAHHVTAALDAVNARLRSAHDALTAVQRDTPRADGGWSVHAVLEHIALTNEAYLAPMQVLASHLQLPRDGGETTTPWRPTFVGKWLARSLEMRMALPAPRRVQPGPRARANVLDTVVGTHRELVSLMAASAHADWSRARMVSPLNALVRLNFGDACVVVLRHSERHTAQIEHLVAQLVAGGQAT
jgi:hypothetical protein